VSTFNTSMQYTIGTALSRAHEAGHCVEVLVDGHWLTGQVVAADGIGVVLENSESEHSIVRMERIAAVRVHSSAPERRRIRPAPPLPEERFADGAMPMPGPRVPAE
jgi:hypothetical protein